MARSLVHLAAAAALGVTVLAAPALAAASAPGRGTFTQITSPATNLTYHFAIGGTNKLHISGRTSLDVVDVDLDCITYEFDATPGVETLASAVPVSAGTFSATVTFTQPRGQCRLMAVPDSANVMTDYLGSFTGPILDTDAFGTSKDAAKVVYGFTALAAQGDGAAIITAAGTCGTTEMETIQTPQMIAGPIMLSCLLALPGTDLGPSGPSTRSAIQVDGRNAYLPASVHDYLIGDRSLPVTQSVLAATESIASNGNVTLTESDVLMRCSAANTYPPTTASCPRLVSTGVRFERVSTLERDGHQVKVRDTFTSIDHHAHSTSLLYGGTFLNESGFPSTQTGDIGYAFPGHGSTFRAGELGQTVTGFGTTAGSLRVRSDLYALPAEPAADTEAVTWSRPPSKIFFGAAGPDVLQMQYAVSVPANGVGFLGFAVSERWTTAEIAPLATAAIADFVVKPTITSPHSGATIGSSTTTVRGLLTAGANGLPTKVLVNGHSARITVASATHASFTVTFTESTGHTHKIVVVAADSAGTSASATVTVKNT